VRPKDSCAVDSMDLTHMTYNITCMAALKGSGAWVHKCGSKIVCPVAAVDLTDNMACIAACAGQQILAS